MKFCIYQQHCDFTARGQNDGKFVIVSKRNVTESRTTVTSVLQQSQLLKLYLVECKYVLCTLEKPKDFEFNLTHIFSNSF